MKDEQRRAAQCRKQELAQASQKRQQQTAMMRKKTRRGQPVMKYRIGKILEHLEQGNQPLPIQGGMRQESVDQSGR